VRTSRSARRQLEAVEWLRSTDELASLPDPLREAAELRLRYPTASLRELASRTDPASTKATVHRRLRLLEGLAADRR
jgi:DNA-binding protein WhiA